MRLLEVILLFLNLVLLAGWLWFQPKPFWLRALAGGAFAVMLIHLLVEGYRWQMVPAYGLTAVYLFLAFAPIPSRPRWQKISLGIAGSVLLLLAVALPVLLPVPRLLTPSGPYTIGTQSYDLVDESRDEQFAPEGGALEGAGKREIMIQVWYPAEAQGDKAPYIENTDIAGPVLAERFSLPGFLFDHINLAITDAYANAPLKQEAATYPVIVFSHGLQGFRMQNTSMVEELASHGYVVVTIDHTYGNMFTVFPDGRVTFYNPDIFVNQDPNPVDGAKLVQQWAGDVGFVLTQMRAWNDGQGVGAERFAGRLNLAEVGVFGHSTGGGTTLEFCRQENHCQAALVLDGWVLPTSEEILAQPYAVPTLFMNTPLWLGETNKARGYEVFNHLTAPGYVATIAGAAHFDFSDLPLFSPLTPQLGLSGGIKNTRQAEILNAYAVAFFDQALKGETSPLLTGTAVYHEVTFESNQK